MSRTTRRHRDLQAISTAIGTDQSEPHDFDHSRLPIPSVLLLAFAAWVGCAVGASWASAGDGRLENLGAALLIAAGVVAAVGLHATRRRRFSNPLPVTVAAFAIALLGCGWSVVRVESDRNEIEAIAARCKGDPTLVCFEGVVATPARGVVPGDRLHAFFRHAARTSFEVDLVSIGPVDGSDPRPVDGRVTVVLREGTAWWRVGDRLSASGRFAPERPAANPGAIVTLRATLDPKRLGSIEVPDARLVDLLDRVQDPASDRWASFDRIRMDWRDRTRAVLDTMLEGTGTGRARDLLGALLLGDRRSAGYRAIRPDFAAAGLAHFLAISGFNLAVVAGVAAIAARACGMRPRRRGLVAIVATALYMLAIPAQLPVLRAGLSAVLLAAGLMLGRRWDGRAAMAIAALVLLAVAPGESIDPGFQLSFAAVFTLQELAPRLRRRWFGDPDRLGRSTRSIVWSRVADAISACVAAWIVSTPIALHHFGMAALAGVPATLLATPIVAATVSFAAVSLPIAAIAPGTSPISGSVLIALGETMLAIADSIASIPGASWRSSPPTAAATILLLAICVWWLVAARRHASFAACAVLGASLGIAAPASGSDDRIEVTVLAVGDGTAIVVQRGTRGTLIDVGSVGDRRAGGSIALRAIESLGIRRLDAVLTSHPNLDHYSGLVEVLARHREAKWFVGEAFVRAAGARPDGPESAALESAARLGRVPGVVAEGDRLELGGLVVRCLHPLPGASFESTNDASLVLRIDPREAPVEESSCRPILLTTGDLEENGLARMAAVFDTIEPWVAEVPHHGSATQETARLLRSKPRTIWVQSTGRRRLDPDLLALLLSEAGSEGGETKVRRLVTARDGAVSAQFAIDRSGDDSPRWRLASLAIHAGRWIGLSEPAR
jgi:competence protein ComEC